MKMRGKFLSTILCLGFLSGCTSTAINQNIHQLSLSDVERLELGRFGKADAIDKFGEPDIKESSAKDHIETWLYFNRPRVETRMSLIFDKAGTLQKKLWFPKTEDSKVAFETVKIRYPNTKFEEFKTPQKGDYIPGESVFVDDRQGIQVLYSELEGVEGISWVLPASPLRRKASQ